MRLYVKDHALRRAKERFPQVFKEGQERRIKDTLLAIGYRGTPVGESIVQGQCFKRGKVFGNEVVVILKDLEPQDGDPSGIIVTCMTAEELEHNGNNRGRAHADQDSRLQEA